MCHRDHLTPGPQYKLECSVADARFRPPFSPPTPSWITNNLSFMSSSSFDFQYAPLGDVSFNPSIYDRWPSTSIQTYLTNTNDLGLSTTCDPRSGYLTSSYDSQQNGRGPRWSAMPASGLKSSQSAPFAHSQSHAFDFTSPPWDTLLPSYNKSDDVNELMHPRIQVPQLKCEFSN